ncbi:hypothetical protein DFP73DRAFT_526333 [Morchella snyderi]|nr:hypothetical protein DFP73DRAFT_526333 [Morchella snyderi]
MFFLIFSFLLFLAILSLIPGCIYFLLGRDMSSHRRRPPTSPFVFEVREIRGAETIKVRRESRRRGKRSEPVRPPRKSCLPEMYFPPIPRLGRGSFESFWAAYPDATSSAVVARDFHEARLAAKQIQLEWMWDRLIADPEGNEPIRQRLAFERLKAAERLLDLARIEDRISKDQRPWLLPTKYSSRLAIDHSSATWNWNEI